MATSRAGRMGRRARRCSHGAGRAACQAVCRIDTTSGSAASSRSRSGADSTSALATPLPSARFKLVDVLGSCIEALSFPGDEPALEPSNRYGSSHADRLDHACSCVPRGCDDVCRSARGRLLAKPARWPTPTGLQACTLPFVLWRARATPLAFATPERKFGRCPCWSSWSGRWWSRRSRRARS